MPNGLTVLFQIETDGTGGSAYTQFFGVIGSFHHRSYVKPWYYNDFFKNAYVSCLLQFDFKLRSDKCLELTLLEVWTGYVDKVQFWCSFGFGILVPSHVLYTYDQGRGTQGDWGSDFPRIRDLYSKSFENSQIQSYF